MGKFCVVEDTGPARDVWDVSGLRRQVTSLFSDLRRTATESGGAYPAGWTP